MNWKRLKPYIIWVLLAEGVGLLAGLLTSDATMIYANTITKPPLAPPAILFPIVWTVLYALMVSARQELQHRQTGNQTILR